MTPSPFAETPHGRLPLPAFFPDGTRAVVRGTSAEDVAGCGIRGVMVNAYHLLSNPGTKVLSHHGGAHRFMGWDGPLSVDSGGFQIYSLLAENPKRGSITRKGFQYHGDSVNERLKMTPEKCVQTQFRIGGDILFCLDVCTHPNRPSKEQEESVALTIDWAKRSRAEFDRLADEKKLDAGERPKLFAVIQGGESESLRRRCAEELAAIGFDGYGYGGWPVSDSGAMSESVLMTAEAAPAGALLWGLGIGRPENIVSAYGAGFLLFDCVLPTRDARKGRLYRFTGEGLAAREFYEFAYLQDDRWAAATGPVDDGCDCLACRRYSMAYLKHLHHLRDGLGVRLATIHNLRFYQRLVERLEGTPHQ